MRRYGLIGYPLQHSFSEGYFTNKFRKEKVDAVYNTFPLKTIGELPSLLDQHPDLAGLNVTHPYKTEVMAYLDAMDEQAEDVGAVNVISISRQEGNRVLKGYNTDVDGFVLSLKGLLDTGVGNALVLGTGGASRAVQKGLDMLAIEYALVSRQKGKADLSYGDLTADIIRNCRLIINATPLGMFPETGSAPDIPYEALEPGCILFDLVYNPAKSLFLRKGQERGCLVKNGMEMLHIQAEKAWEIWKA